MAGNDATPPPSWPPGVAYLVRPRLERAFPKELVPLLTTNAVPFNPRPSTHPSSVGIKIVSDPSHPAHGQRSLVALKRISRNTLVLPYLGVLHATLTAAVDDPATTPNPLALKYMGGPDPHADSDYDLSLLRLSASDIRNPFPGTHVSIGVDAAQAGNAARFVNDYRGVSGAGANAEFRLGRGEGGEMRMEVWSRRDINKGEELLVSYGKGWWGARTGNSS